MELGMPTFGRKHLCFLDKRIRRKKERVTVLMSCMVVGGGLRRIWTVTSSRYYYLT
jgi:hypothetical protein